MLTRPAMPRRASLYWLARVVVPLVLAWSMPLHALTLRLCVEEDAHLPSITPQGHGEIGELIRRAAAQAGIEVTFRAVPLLRCREEVRTNRVDGYPIAPYTASLTGFVAFPMHNSAPDRTAAVAIWRLQAYRRAGSRVEWDGQRFKNLATPVLIPAGGTLLMDRLAAMEVPVERSSKTMEMNFLKLLAGRADVAIDIEAKGNVLMQQDRFQRGIEMLRPAFAEVPVYLGLSRRFYELHTEAAEQLWQEIARLRKAAPDAPQPTATAQAGSG